MQSYDTALIGQVCDVTPLAPLLFPLFRTCLLPLRLVINVVMVIYFVLGERTKFFSQALVLFMSNIYNFKFEEPPPIGSIDVDDIWLLFFHHLELSYCQAP